MATRTLSPKIKVRPCEGTISTGFFPATASLDADRRYSSGVMSTFAVGIEHFAALIPAQLLAESGKVFYSGRSAFAHRSPLYVLGVNPGGAPENYPTETVGNHTRLVLEELPDDWSAYRDEVWEGAAPGTYGMAPRVLHLLRQLTLKPDKVPATNLIFVRSRSEACIRQRWTALADLCWPLHACIIATLRPRVILCLGGTVGKYACKRLAASRLVGQFVERNNRRWKSQVFEDASGLRIVVATHPSRADWSAPATDPSGLVRQALRRSPARCSFGLFACDGPPQSVDVIPTMRELDDKLDERGRRG